MELVKTPRGFHTLMRGDIAAREVPATACGNWLFQAAVLLGWINLTACGQDLKLYSSLARSGY